MRVALQNDSTASQFSRQLLALGNGQIPVDVEGRTHHKSISQNYKNINWIIERAILAANNKEVDSLNFIIQNQSPGELHSYTSVDSVTDETEATNYPTEFLNSLDVPGILPHNLQLRVGSTIIMLRNLNHPNYVTVRGCPS